MSEEMHPKELALMAILAAADRAYSRSDFALCEKMYIKALHSAQSYAGTNSLHVGMVLREFAEFYEASGGKEQSRFLRVRVKRIFQHYFGFPCRRHMRGKTSHLGPAE